MPKEVTHFLIARKVLERLLQDEFWQPIEAYEKEAALGAVFHDALFYLRDKSDDELMKVPDTLHGARGEDTLVFMKHCLKNEAGDGSIDWQLLAFLVGAVTHVYTDAAFHPLVYYFTGNYFDEDPLRRSSAVRGHRKIEALIDVLMAGGLDNIKKYQIEDLVDDCKGLDMILEKVLKNMYPDKSNLYTEKYLQAYKSFGSLRRKYTNTLVMYAAGFLGDFMPRKYRELAAVAYDKRALKFRRLLEGPIDFINPLSGEKESKSLKKLEEVAVENSLEYLNGVKDYFIMGDEKVFLINGPSLEDGLYNSFVDRMSFFSKVPFFEKEV